MKDLMLQERVITIVGHEKKKIAIYISRSDGKGTYPARRAAMIAQTLTTEMDILFLRGEESPPTPAGYKEIEVGNSHSLLRILTDIKPDLLIRDSGSTVEEDVEKIRGIVPSIIHFDDFGDGGKSADLVFQTLYTETNDPVPEHYVVGLDSFIADEEILGYKQIGLRKQEQNPLPHLVISFGDEDAGNLSYRALRHMLQLQIPLKVTVLLGENYAHDISTLRMMALGRRNTFILEYPHNFAEVCASADVILCASGYMPYEVAVMGIPCVVLAQNDFEAELAFPKEQHGFIHLGLGRKVKQSSLLNAIMEPLLHEPLRKKAIARQTALGLGDGKDAVCEAIRYFVEYPKRSLLKKRTGKETSNMLH
jgi:spore coat polysaccharide biosynthesis predicted glycosyltransferase SpsG